MATTTKTTKAPAKKAGAKKAPVKKKSFLSEEEIEAMQATKAERKGGSGETQLKEAIAKLTGNDKTIVEKLDKIMRANAPNLTGKTWYGLPAWANADGKAVVFFTPGVKFKERYASIGFGTSAKLDDGHMWQTSFAVLQIGEAEEKKLAALVNKAVG